MIWWIFFSYFTLKKFCRKSNSFYFELWEKKPWYLYSNWHYFEGEDKSLFDAVFGEPVSILDIFHSSKKKENTTRFFSYFLWNWHLKTLFFIVFITKLSSSTPFQSYLSFTRSWPSSQTKFTIKFLKITWFTNTSLNYL